MFEGAYQGNQAGGDNILGMLEVIETDFARTKSETKAAEKEAAANHVLFKRESAVCWKIDI
jgi:hypothetical protein